MQIVNQKTELVPVSQLRPHPQNPKRGNKFEVARSIATNGFYGFVGAQASTKYILFGHQRIEAAKLEGASEVPVVWLDVDDDTARRIMLADNRTADLGTYDDELLASVLENIKIDEGQLTGTGYSQEDLDDLYAKIRALPGEFESDDEFTDEDSSNDQSDFKIIKIKLSEDSFQSWKQIVDDFVGDEVEAFEACMEAFLEK
jgi:ParB-like chromosome segregation protein Spo0J